MSDCNKSTGNLKHEFPYLTFCKPIEQLRDHHTLALNILQNSTYQTFGSSLIYDIQDINDIIDLYIYNNGKITYLRRDVIWSKVYHKYYGACYTLDIRKDKSLKIEKGNVKLGFESLKRWNIYIHDLEDFSALTRLTFSIKKLYYGMICRNFKIRKLKYETVPTNTYPCGEKHFLACREFEVFQVGM